MVCCRAFVYHCVFVATFTLVVCVAVFCTCWRCCCTYMVMSVWFDRFCVCMGWVVLTCVCHFTRFFTCWRCCDFSVIPVMVCCRAFVYHCVFVSTFTLVFRVSIFCTCWRCYCGFILVFMCCSTGNSKLVRKEVLNTRSCWFQYHKINNNCISNISVLQLDSVSCIWNIAFFVVGNFRFYFVNNFLLISPDILIFSKMPHYSLYCIWICYNIVYSSI